jgi:hypothetical protein
VASLQAAFDVLRGKRIERWEPARVAKPEAATAGGPPGAADPAQDEAVA